MIGWFSPKPKQDDNQQTNSYRKTYLVFVCFRLKVSAGKFEGRYADQPVQEFLVGLCGYRPVTALTIKHRIEGQNDQKYGVIYETDDEADAWRVHKGLWEAGYEVPQFGTNPTVDGLAE